MQVNRTGRDGRLIMSCDTTGMVGQCGVRILHNFNWHVNPSEKDFDRVKEVMYNANAGSCAKILMSDVKERTTDSLCKYLNCQHGTTKTNPNSDNDITVYEIDIEDLK